MLGVTIYAISHYLLIRNMLLKSQYNKHTRIHFRCQRRQAAEELLVHSTRLTLASLSCLIIAVLQSQSLIQNVQALVNP